jgi:hypothetical protein
MPGLTARFSSGRVLGRADCVVIHAAARAFFHIVAARSQAPFASTRTAGSFERERCSRKIRAEASRKS